MSSEISGRTTMGEILGTYPSARLELFRRYHVGGCAACGYQLTDTLEQVCREHSIPDALVQVIDYIRNSREVEAKLQILPTVLVRSSQHLQATEPSRVVSLSGDDLTD